MNLQGEYEFVTGLISDLKYEVHPNKSAYGFILRKSDWGKKFIKIMLFLIKYFLINVLKEKIFKMVK